MQSPSTRIASGANPVLHLDAAPNVHFLEFASTYGEALALLPSLRGRLLDGQSIAIYRVSKSQMPTPAGVTVYLSRQTDVKANGQEVHPPALKGTTQMAYELYAVPTDLLTTANPPDESELSLAIATVRAQRVPIMIAGDPQPSGPNVVGPSSNG